ncbi:hypothetical protein MUK42_00864 [Musa troglodytarum]|uniref:Uncharacterized protein n=1 Tax=Musa troglodytarum TaxID=320322 RepID=A0A9E7F802_9LILI|nr:hypothetical protein MUK42_00864 [Musa troglodytarum]
MNEIEQVLLIEFCLSSEPHGTTIVQILELPCVSYFEQKKIISGIKFRIVQGKVEAGQTLADRKRTPSPAYGDDASTEGSGRNLLHLMEMEYVGVRMKRLGENLSLKMQRIRIQGGLRRSRLSDMDVKSPFVASAIGGDLSPKLQKMPTSPCVLEGRLRLLLKVLSGLEHVHAVK